MTDAVDKLFALQELQFGPGSKDSWSRMARLRRDIDGGLLAKYDRLASRGKRPVSIVRNGVCSTCHIGLAVGVIFQLTQGQDTLCDTCGRFLRLEDATAPAQTGATR
jgi:predicted  nucleic acid-binding Zn-ribbon protein